jgi:hypothetical protein
MIFYAIWYNPQNPQHNLCLNIPQLIEYANQSKMYEFGQFWISKKKKLLNKLKFINSEIVVGHLPKSEIVRFSSLRRQLQIIINLIRR